MGLYSISAIVVALLELPEESIESTFKVKVRVLELYFFGGPLAEHERVMC